MKKFGKANLNNFIKVWEKSQVDNPKDEEIVSAGKDLLNILRFDLLLKGVELTAEPEVVCVLKNPVPVSDLDNSSGVNFSQRFAVAFENETAREWNHDDYFVVKVPMQTLGGSVFVVFSKK